MKFQRRRYYFLYSLFSIALFSYKETETEVDKSTINLNSKFNANEQALVKLVNKYRIEGCKCGNERIAAVSTITEETLLKTAYSLLKI